jgi:SAM-dependent methyltransferase
VVSEIGRLREAASRGPMVDLACGRGRHALHVAGAGLPCIGVDRNRSHLEELRLAARARDLAIGLVQTDLEARSSVPLRDGSCGAVLVFRYLWRPLCPAIEALLAPGGVLLYETFTLDQRKLGYGPRNAEFLLGPGELARLFPGLETVDSWEGKTTGQKPAAVARLIARRA